MSQQGSTEAEQPNVQMMRRQTTIHLHNTSCDYMPKGRALFTYSKMHGYQCQFQCFLKSFPFKLRRIELRWAVMTLQQSK